MIRDGFGYSANDEVSISQGNSFRQRITSRNSTQGRLLPSLRIESPKLPMNITVDSYSLSTPDSCQRLFGNDLWEVPRDVCHEMKREFKAWGRGKVIALKTIFSILLLGIFINICQCWRVQLKYNALDKEITKLSLTKAKTINILDQTIHQVRSTERGIFQQESLKKTLTLSLKDSGVAEGGQRREEMEEFEKALQQRVDRLHHEIQANSRREAIERFGEGPHRVEFVVEFEHDNNSHGSFVVEMASLESMPHSVNHFLHMIDHKLWDDTIFMQHVSHVIQTSPKDYKTYESVEDRFYEAGLTHLSFQEYSREYPHDEYTLGFEGRPGGPQFYINMENNQRIHGPGGQMHHDLHEEGEPCFGKIVSGKHVVDRMAQKNNEAGMAASAPRVVRIVSARLMHHLTPKWASILHQYGK